MGIKDKTFYFNIGDRKFEVVAGMHCLVGLKKILGVDATEIFDPDFNWADEENIRGAIAGCLYRSLRHELRTRDPEDVADAVGDMLDEDYDRFNDKDRERRFGELAKTMMEVYVMSKFHRTPDELVAEVNKSLEEQKEATTGAKAQKKTKPRKAASTGSRSTRTASI